MSNLSPNTIRKLQTALNILEHKQLRLATPSTNLEGNINLIKALLHTPPAPNPLRSKQLSHPTLGTTEPIPKELYQQLHNHSQN